MNKMMKLVAVALVVIFGIVSCAPINTPNAEVNRRNAEANQRVADGVGRAALGVAAAIAAGALYKREQRKARQVWYGPWGRYRYQYWNPYYGRWMWR